MAVVRKFGHTVGMTADIEQLLLRVTAAHEKRAHVKWERCLASEEIRRTLSVYLTAVYFYRQQFAAASRHLRSQSQNKSCVASQPSPQMATSQL